MTWLTRCLRYLSSPIRIEPLVFFRVGFGAIMFWEVCRYFDKGWIERYFIRPKLLFKYYGFGWVHPWPGDGMYIHFAVMGLLALMIAAGLFYRVAATLFFFAFTYVFLLEQTIYLNHFYLICWVSLIMAFLPAGDAYSLDARIWPRKRREWVPAWTLDIVRFQLGIAYFFGGVAKLNWDWLRGEPMRTWLGDRYSYPVLGPWLATEPSVYFFSYGGLLFDLLIVPALIWKRTRPWAFMAAVGFHLTNATIFRIGIFPWFMLVATLVFFPPESFARAFSRLFSNGKPGAPRPKEAPLIPPLTAGALTLFVLIHLTLPLRHFLYPGNVSWTEEGHHFAWHMKLRTKGGELYFVATDRNGTWTIDPRDYISGRQLEKVAGHPDYILQLARYIAADLRARGHQDLQIRAKTMASLNNRRSQPLIDENVDLAAVERSMKHATWILPLTEPLRSGEHPESGQEGADPESE